MFRIRMSSIDSVVQANAENGDVLRNQYYCELEMILRRRFPSETDFLSDEELRTRVVNGHHQAAAHQVRTKSGVAKWMILDLLYGPEFFTVDEFVAFWERSTGGNSDQKLLAPEEKLDVLIETANQSIQAKVK